MIAGCCPGLAWSPLSRPVLLANPLARRSPSWAATVVYGGVAARRWLPSARPRPPVSWPLGSTSSGGRRGPVSAGCPYPASKQGQAPDSGHDRGRRHDQGDLPAGQAGGGAVEGVGRGPEPDELGGRDW